MGANLKIVDIGVTNLNNIPDQLRKMADQIERNPEEGLMTLVYARYFDDGEVIPGAFGNNPSKAEVVGIFDLASRCFTPYVGISERD